MQTPIDFGKNFLNSFFSNRDPDLCLEDLAYDVVWITPGRMYHFLSAKEIRDFLQEEMTAKPERYYVDIVSIKSSPSAADISTVAYEINLVPKKEEKAVYLRCSMAICKRGQHFEITFLHMSEKQGVGGMEQIREFTENLPCGVLIFAYMKDEGPKTLFYNEYFWKKLHYKEDQFQKQMERDPFFMVSEEERDKIVSRLKEIQGTNGHLAVNLTFFRRDGNRFQYRMIGAPAYQEGDNTVYYCVFQETTGFNQLHSQMQERVAAASEILGRIPGALCVLTGEPGNWHPVYVSKHFPEKFDMSMASFADAVAGDPFYRLEMTSITRKRLTEAHLEMISKDPYLGMFEMEQADGTKRWTDVYLINSASRGDSTMRMLFYVDRDEVRKATDQQIAKAEQASRMQQERARVEIREAQEKARLQVEEAQTTVRKEIEEAQAKTQEQIEAFRTKMNEVLSSQKGSIEVREKQLRLEYEAREQEMQRGYAEKEQLLEKQIENYRKAQEAELAKMQRTIDLLTADCDKELSDKQKEIQRLEEELGKTMDALRESESIREQQRRSSELREQEQRGTVKKLQDMIETLQKVPAAQVQENGPTAQARENAPVVSHARGNASVSQPRENVPASQARENASASQERENAPASQARENASASQVRGNASASQERENAPASQVRGNASASQERENALASQERARRPASAFAAGGIVGSVNVNAASDPEDSEDGWMDNMGGNMDGTIIRRGAVSHSSRSPFSSGLRPEGTSRKEEPVRRGTVSQREEPVRRGTVSQREEPVRRGTVSQREEPARRGAASRQEDSVRRGAAVPQDGLSARRSADLRNETEAYQENNVDHEEAAPSGNTVMDDLVEMAASDDRVLKEELFSIDECLKNVMVLQEPVCAKKRIKLELKKSVSMPDEAIGDKAKLQRALVSLLETAAEQTPQGGLINLGCRADRASGNRAYLYFSIRDNGSTIASDLMQGMFEMKDERDDPLRAGLYIAREIVSIMGGNVRVRSRRGEGTEFMVTVCMKLP